MPFLGRVHRVRQEWEDTKITIVEPSENANRRTYLEIHVLKNETKLT